MIHSVSLPTGTRLVAVDVGLKALARRIRAHCLRMTHRGKSGHVGSMLSMAELLAVLAQARAAQSFPWDARRTIYWRTVFPQMTNWLPDDEAAQLRFEFETEIRRLEAA